MLISILALAMILLTPIQITEYKWYVPAYPCTIMESPNGNIVLEKPGGKIYIKEVEKNAP